MKGVAKIKGPKNPKIGEDSFYEVVEFHKGTVVIDPSTVKWKISKKEDGKWVEAKGNAKSGKRVSFNFSQRSYAKDVLVEAYIFEAEGKTPPGLVVKPCMGVRKIKSTEILNGEGGKITQMPKYGQNITLRATTENMIGEVLKLSVWERDTYSDKGHDPKGNQLLWSGNSKKVNNKGFGEQKILLSPDMMMKADKSMFDGSEHEYYLVVEADKIKTMSATTQVSSEIVLSPGNHQVAKKDPLPAKETSLIDQAILKIKNATGWEPITVKGITTAVIEMFSAEKIPSCEQKHCIKKGDKSELIREINIRLAGFGGNVPTDEFTDRTEKMVKQFQKDYMKVEETGKVCGNVLLAIDDFSLKFDISSVLWRQIDCSCETKGKSVISKLREIKELNSCNGWGDGTGKGTYKTGSAESAHKYEYPGIHRSLLFGIKALQFYFSKQTTYKIDHVTSGYRCRFKNYVTTNHQGKAIDIQFSKGTKKIRGEDKDNLPILRDIRDSLYIKYLGAQKEWPAKNLYSIEPIDLLYDKKGNVRFDYTFSWIHVDVREFDTVYLEDKYFCKNAIALNGKTIIQLAKDSGFEKTCMCVKAKALVEPSEKDTKAGCYCDKDLTAQNLIDVGVSTEKASTFLEAINKTFTDYKITSCLRKAHFLAQIIHESGGFRFTEELDVADTAYGGYKGRGLIQLTGEKNYEAYGAYENEDFTSSLKNKQRLEKLPYSARLAGWFWTESAKLNDDADLNDHINVTRVINGGFNGYNDRTKYIKKGFNVFYNNCKNDSGKNTNYEFNLSKSYNNKRGAFAWGLWHDPGLNKDGCTKDKQKSIEGYTQFIELAGDNYEEKDWYNIKNISSFKNLKYTIGKTSHVKVIDAAKQRLEELKK